MREATHNLALRFEGAICIPTAEADAEARTRRHSSCGIAIGQSALSTPGRSVIVARVATSRSLDKSRPPKLLNQWHRALTSASLGWRYSPRLHSLVDG